MVRVISAGQRNLSELETRERERERLQTTGFGNGAEDGNRVIG